MVGGTVVFDVVASGSPPLTYHWFFEGDHLVTMTIPTLMFENVNSNMAGLYQVVVSNAFGTATSEVVRLSVEVATQPVILWQPYGDTVGVGAHYNFSVVAAGAPPLRYQWYKNGVEIANATNRTLALPSVELADGGIYTVRVENPVGIVWSLGAKLIVTSSVPEGGQVLFGNGLCGSWAGTTDPAPVYDVDGVTLLSGSNYVAQLYAGPSVERLRPVSAPTPFQSGLKAGYFYPQTVRIPTVGPGSNAIVQVRVWEWSKGSTYEEARAFGGKFGQSDLLTVTLGSAEMPPACLTGLRAFRLEAGRPEFVTGRILSVERRPDGRLVLAHEGEVEFQ